MCIFLNCSLPLERQPGWFFPEKQKKIFYCLLWIIVFWVCWFQRFLPLWESFNIRSIILVALTLGTQILSKTDPVMEQLLSVLIGIRLRNRTNYLPLSTKKQRGKLILWKQCIIFCFGLIMYSLWFVPETIALKTWPEWTHQSGSKLVTDIEKSFFSNGKVIPKTEGCYHETFETELLEIAWTLPLVIS